MCVEVLLLLRLVLQLEIEDSYTQAYTDKPKQWVLLNDYLCITVSKEYVRTYFPCMLYFVVRGLHVCAIYHLFPHPFVCSLDMSIEEDQNCGTGLTDDSNDGPKAKVNYLHY